MENQYYNEFNKFQTLFFTDTEKFKEYSNYEIKRFGYILINNIAKGFPNLADILYNLKGLNWTGITSPEILKALQHNFVNKYVKTRVPPFVYYKNLKPEKDTQKAKVSKKSKKLLDFDNEIQRQISEILRFDSKTYEYLKYSEKVQFLGKQLLGEWVQSQRIKENQKAKKPK